MFYSNKMSFESGSKQKKSFGKMFKKNINK